MIGLTVPNGISYFCFMQSKSVHHYAFFTDESYLNNRYRCIASFSLPYDKILEVHHQIKDMVKQAALPEFKWSGLNKARARDCAQDMIMFVINNLDTCDLRVDALIWDIQDSRHQVKDRDDRANFQYMYYKLLKVAIEKRPVHSTVYIYPDQKTDVQWKELAGYLESTGRRKNIADYPLFGESNIMRNYTIRTFRQVQSEECYAVQMADLFAGLPVFSVDAYSRYRLWKEEDSGEYNLFQQEEEQRYSSREKYRFPVLRMLEEETKRQKLGVSLNTNKRLHTYNPRNRLNFWHYEPQHEKDKAPVKKG